MSTVYYWNPPSDTGEATPQLSTACPNCEARLILHQPDPELDDRLLGTCDDCKEWYLVDGEGQITHALPRPEGFIF
jgi:hypothetical protein